METTGIILAAGLGKRMGGSVPKQYQMVNGHPLVYYTLEAFVKSEVDQIILVTGKEDIEWTRRELLAPLGEKKMCQVVAGGKQRPDSVYQGLLAAKGSEYVLIHDGARPFLSNQIIHANIEAAKRYQAAVTAVPVKDTIKMINGEGFVEETPDRRSLYGAQTPQTFSYALILEAYQKMYRDENCEWDRITDDAMVVQAYGGVAAKVVEGSYDNFKLTTPEDLVFAEEYLKKNSGKRAE